MHPGRYAGAAVSRTHLFSPLFPHKRRWLWFAAGLVASTSFPPTRGIRAQPLPPVLESRQEVTAAELTGTMRKSLAVIAKVMQTRMTEPALRTRKARAFQAALTEAAAGVDVLADAVGGKEKDASVFTAMRRAGASLAALQVSFRYNGIEDDDVEEGFGKLTAAYGVFRRNYGRDLIMAKTEAESALSPAQKSALENVKTRANEWSKRLAGLQPTLKDNPAAAFEIEALLRGLNRLEKARRDRRGLLNALATAELLGGRWGGLKIYLATVYPADAGKLAPGDTAAAAFGTANQHLGDAVFGAENPGALFAQPAVYAEDLNVEGVNDREVPALLKSLGTPAPVTTPEPATEKTTDATDRAADREINADDPDDDTSLEAGAEEDAATAGPTND